MNFVIPVSKSSPPQERYYNDVEGDTAEVPNYLMYCTYMRYCVGDLCTDNLHQNWRTCCTRDAAVIRKDIQLQSIISDMWYLLIHIFTWSIHKTRRQGVVTTIRAPSFLPACKA